jgi:hypothetical protein
MPECKILLFLSDKTDFSLCLFYTSAFLQTGYIFFSTMEIVWEERETMKISVMITDPGYDLNQIVLKFKSNALLSY